MKILLFAAGLVLAGCTTTGIATAPLPLEAQLASACSSIATGYRTAAIFRVQGKLTQTSIDTLTNLEPAITATCDPAHPPADLAGAVNAMLVAVQTITLTNAGVK